MGQEVILVDRKRSLWFDFGKKLEVAKDALRLNPGSELMYDHVTDDWWDWQWNSLTFCGCVYESHDRCRHGPVPADASWPKVGPGLRD